jgi:4-amino-4-deoxy-L-arabinose transferase-like glycosyltransferase
MVGLLLFRDRGNMEPDASWPWTSPGGHSSLLGLRSKLPALLIRPCQALSESRVTLPLLLTALAFALRVYRLDDQSLWFDEAWTADVVSQNCLGILQATAEDIHPPAYFLGLHFWTIVLGNSAFALRMFSVLPSVATVAFAYSFARRVQGHLTGLTAATIVTLAPLQVYYAQEARSYALMPLLTLASSYCLLRVSAEQRRPGPGIDLSRWLLSYVAVSTLSLYTHYTAAYVLVAQIFFLIHLCWRRRRVAGAVLAAPVLIFLCCLPWVLYLWGHRTGWSEAALLLGSDPLPFRFVWLWRNLMAVNFGPTAIPPLAQDAAEVLQVTQIIMMVVVTLGAVQACRTSTGTQSDGGWLLVWTFLIALVLVTFVTVPGDPRHIMVSTPSYYLLLALGMERAAGGIPFGRRRLLRRPLVGAAVLFLVVAASAFFLNNQYHVVQYRKADDFKTIFPTMEWLARPDDAVILTYGPLQLVLDYYWKGLAPDTYLVPSEQDWADLEFHLSDAERRLSSLLGSHARYWLIEDLGMSLDEGQVERWLSDNTYEVVRQNYNRTRISLFSVPGKNLAAKDLQANFGATLLFHDPESDGTQLESGSPLHYALHWGLLRETDTDFSVSLWLADTSDCIYASHKSLLSEWARWTIDSTAGDEIEQRIGLLVPPGTPPGTYRVKLAVYDIGTSLPLSILDQDSMPVGTELLLDEVEVIPAEFNPDGELAPVDHRVHKDLTDSLRILGYNSVPDRVVLASTVLLDLFWQAIEKPIVDYRVAVALVDMQGSRVYQQVAEPANGRHPFSAWGKGEIIIDKRSAVVPVNTHVGQHQLFVALVDPETQLQKAEVCLGSVLVVDRPRRFTLPLVEHQVNSIFDGKVKLLGYELTPAVAAPGAYVHVVLYWQAERPMQTSYTAFVHLVDDKQHIWGQMDSIPGRGTVPTTGWLQGEVIIDSYDVPIAEGAPDSSYHIEVGLYDAANGQRLAVAGSGGDVLGDSIVLDTIVGVLAQ